MSDKTMQHTPGPWEIYLANTSNEGDLIIKYTDQQNLTSHICRLYETALCEEHGTTEANARLIAAAPELFSLLVELAAHAAVYGAVPKSATLLWGRVDVALAKAEGK